MHSEAQIGDFFFPLAKISEALIDSYALTISYQGLRHGSPALGP